MKKSDYWKIVRKNRADSDMQTQSDPSRLTVVNEDGLASYAYDYWKQNGVLPDDYLPISGKEESGNVLRNLWEIVEKDPTFQTAVLDAYKKHYLVNDRDAGDEWHRMTHEGFGPFFSTVEALQLRIIIHEALRLSKGVGPDWEKHKGLMQLCVEYCCRKWRAGKFETSARAFFNNADLLSLISKQNVATISEVETVLATFEKVRKGLESYVDSFFVEDVKTFDEDIRPILVGKLIKKAKTFAAWLRVFNFSINQGTKIYALYHMSNMAKSLYQMVELYRSAQDVGLTAIAESAKASWQDLCSNMKPEELVNLPSSLHLDSKFLENLILEKCED